MGTKKPPYAAIAEEKPITAADSMPARRNDAVLSTSLEFAPKPRSCKVRKITGIMRNVEALPMPVSTNSTMNSARKPRKFPPEAPLGRKYSTPPTAAIIRPNTQNVSDAPPVLSDNQPPIGRAIAPTRGPRKA